MAVKGAAKPVKFSERATRFFRGVWSELKKVHWPNRKEIMVYTAVVLVSVFVVSIMIWIVDTIFSFLLSLIL